MTGWSLLGWLLLFTLGKHPLVIPHIYPFAVLVLVTSMVAGTLAVGMSIYLQDYAVSTGAGRILPRGKTLLRGAIHCAQSQVGRLNKKTPSSAGR